MKIPHDGGRAFAIDVARFWLEENGKVLLLLFGLTVIVIVGLAFLTRQYTVPGVEEQAEVVRFGAHGDYDGDHLLVVVRTQDGSVRTVGASPGDIFYCHPGSRIRLIRHGTALTVEGPACTAGA
jgi:hypothetical protein